MDAAAFEHRLAKVEAVHAIHNLIAGFARGADAHCDPVLLRPLFTDDAVFDIGQFGRLEGGDHIVSEMHRNNARGFYWTLHYLTSPAIEVADDLRSAQVFYYLWETATHPKPGIGDVAYWIGGWYDALAVPHGDGAWRFKHLKLTIKLLSPYAEGWKPIPNGFDEL